jgi:nucleotide-binding universal stress UspA family protein
MPWPAGGNPSQGLSRILAPVEFSDRCAAAVRYALPLARYFRSELLLLHVIPPAPPEMDEELYANRVATAEQRLEHFAAEELAGLSVRRLVVKGDSARKIVQCAQDEHANVILMSTHGFGPFRRFLLGSTTAKVLHDATCPVWTGVHMEETPAHPFFPLRCILCAVDLGPESERALLWAASLQKQTGAQLTMLHSVPIVPNLATDAGTDWNVAMRAAAEQEIERLRSHAGVTADLDVEAGDPAQAIGAAAHRLPADLVVIGRGSAAGVFGRLRANAYAIIRQSPCPVISV